MSILNLSYKFFERLMRGSSNLLMISMGNNLKPKWIWFGVTDRCNSRCTHCNIWKKKDKDEILTLEEIRRAFNDPLFKNVEGVINSGGEVLLRNDIQEILELEHELFPKAVINISTNGLLPEVMLKLVNNMLAKNIKINASVSLDGIGQKHDEIRGVPDNFKKVDYLLYELTKLRSKYPDKLSLVLGFTLSSLTVENWEEVNSYSNNIGIDLSAQWYNQSSFYDNNDIYNKNENKIFEVVAKQPNTIIRDKWLKLLKNKSIKFKCFAAQSFFALKCNGDIVPCLTNWDDVLGNVREKTPSEIWQSKSAEKARKKISQCEGCLNSWGVEWSASTIFYPRLFFYIKNPLAIIDRLKRK
jgi:MoaA/NifB/PqqE/SkfB family radical SAM enzyme